VHVTWQITSPSIIARLLGTSESPATQPPVIPLYMPETEQKIACVEIPADIDSLLADDPQQAHNWRARVRAALLSAFAEALIITGFQPATPEGQPSLVLERRDSAAP
jgi:predicted GNAT superfamily acetyltransferase